MSELAQEIAAIANRSFGDRADLQAAAREVIAKSSAADAASLAWAVLLEVARAQARTEPPRRITWRPSMIRRRA